MNKKKIICIIGESGTGKSTMASFFIENGYNEVLSHTDRPKRTEDENGHIFHTKESFDEISEQDKIATTIYGSYRYCTSHDDVKDNGVFVVDEPGLKELLDYNYLYDITTIRLYRNNIEVDNERKQRNLSDYKMKQSEFDIVINNDGRIEDLKVIVDTICDELKEVVE